MTEQLDREPLAKVKICGLTNLADAELAVELGAWALGMIFYEHSPRRCAAAEAARIAAAMQRRVEVCGVFVNAPLDEVVRLAAELPLSLLQFHGDEGPAYCREAARRTGVRVIRAKQVGGAADLQDIERYHVDFHLLDARSRKDPSLRGGTGETFEWSLLDSRRSSVPLILSGGITPQNAAEAVERVHPYAIDSASGTESAPGHKDPALMRALFDALAAPAAQPDEIGQPA
jgi:phosphoribosylanthranilate isomerase